MTRTEPSLWRELQELRPLGDVEQAVALGRAAETRSRRGRWLITAVAAAAVVAVVGVSAWWSPERPADPADEVPPPDSAPAIESRAVEISERIEDWMPGQLGPSDHAPVGTALARRCAEACRHLLVRADGTTIPVADVSPDLAELLADADPRTVSLPSDAGWLALPDAGSVRLYPLKPGTSVPVVFEPSDPSYRWELVGWGSGYTSAALAEYDGAGTPVRYGYADLADREVFAVDAPEAGRYGPVGQFGVGVQVGDRARAGARLTAVRQLHVPVEPNDRWTAGTVDALPETSTDEMLDLSGLMAPAETLAGPDGFAELVDPPPSSFAAFPQQVTVFEDGRRTGLIVLGPGGPARLGYAEVQGWQLLGPIRPDQAALTTTRDGKSLVKGHSDAGIEWQHELPGNVTWYLPGLRP